MFFRDYFSSCGFLVQSRKNVRSDFFSFFFFTRVFAREHAPDCNGERLGIFRRSDRTYARENEKSDYFFAVYCDAENASTSSSRRRCGHHRPSLCRRFRAHVILKCPRDDLSRSDVTIYEPLRAETR